MVNYNRAMIFPEVDPMLDFDIQASMPQITSTVQTSLNGILSQPQNNFVPNPSGNINPNFGDILQAGIGGALGQIGNVLTQPQTTTGQIVGQVGSNAINNSLTTWLKEHWLGLLGVLLGAALVITLFVKFVVNKKRR